MQSPRTAKISLSDDASCSSSNLLLERPRPPAPVVDQHVSVGRPPPGSRTCDTYTQRRSFADTSVASAVSFRSLHCWRAATPICLW